MSYIRPFTQCPIFGIGLGKFQPVIPKGRVGAREKVQEPLGCSAEGAQAAGSQPSSVST